MGGRSADDDQRGRGSAANRSATRDAPATAGLLVVHGAGPHAPITTLTEILNPTFHRMRVEETLVGIEPHRVGDERAPGGAYEALTVDYTTEPATEGRKPPEVRRLLVVEGRWDESFLDSPVKDVSVWAGTHVARMMWELLCYQARSWYAFPLAIGTLLLISLGLWVAVAGHGEAWAWGLVLGGLGVAFAGGLLDAFAPWSPRHERSRAGRRELWRIALAFTMMIYHVQRGLVMLVALFAIAFLPLLAFVSRLLATIPGLNWLARGTLNTFETFLLTGAPTDVEAISNNHVSAGAIQARVRGALLELESRLPAGSAIVVLAHSAGAPISWWLLSEPGIHERQGQKRMEYRLITVGGALNWAHRGMDTHATPLTWPLVNSDRAAGDWRTHWLNVYTFWDPAPHGPIRTKEYQGDWRTCEHVKGEPDEEEEQAEGRLLSIVAALPLVGRLVERARTSWENACSVYRDDKGRPDPNLIMCNLGSPISAEHSEYFRNQQEFVPLFAHVIDPDIEWATQESMRDRNERWGNARHALMSALVRARIIAFAVPAAFITLAARDRRIFTSVEEHRHRFTGDGWLDERIASIGDAMRSVFANIPLLGDQSGTVAAHIWIEDAVVLVVLALIVYALVDAYTNFCWASLGRRVVRLARTSEREKPTFSIEARPVGGWKLASVPLWPMVLVWVPALLAPLLLWPFELGEAWSVLAGAAMALTVAEVVWFRQCLRSIAEPEKYRETGVIQRAEASPLFGV